MEIRNYLTQFDALIFDVDGTLIDSMKLHNQAWIETLSAKNCIITSEILYKYAGIPNFKTIELFNQQFGWNLDPDEISQEKEARFLKKLTEIKPINPVVDLVKYFYERKPMAIVSGGSKRLINSMLELLNLHHYFQITICAGDTKKGKPDPEPFLMAANSLSIPSSRCLVFEDGEAGIQGARSAGMKIIKVLPDQTLSIL